VWEGWEAGFLAFHAFHTLSFPGLLWTRVSKLTIAAKPRFGNRNHLSEMATIGTCGCLLTQWGQFTMKDFFITGKRTE
jgi:hypothetical protein